MCAGQRRGHGTGASIGAVSEPPLWQ